MMGIKPFLGRFLAPADDVKVNGSQVMVFSYACWQVRFAGDPDIVGKTVRLNKIPYTVIGVAPQYFNGTEQFSLAGAMDSRSTTNCRLKAMTGSKNAATTMPG